MAHWEKRMHEGEYWESPSIGCLKRYFQTAVEAWTIGDQVDVVFLNRSKEEFVTVAARSIDPHSVRGECGGDFVYTFNREALGHALGIFIRPAPPKQRQAVAPTLASII